MKKKKIIGICMANANEHSHAEFIRQIQKCAANEFKLIIFHSVADYPCGDSLDERAAIYSCMNFDLLDAVIIFDEQFRDKALVRRIIGRAQEKRLPVVVVGAEYEGCCSVIGDFRDAYIEVMTHVIREHSVSETLFVGDGENEKLIECYKTALSECKAEFSEKNICTAAAFEKRETLPKAVFCANDRIAAQVCETLSARGIRVPEDIIVTGFGGSPEGSLFAPQLTTCKEDISALAELCIDVIRNAPTETENRAFPNRWVPCIRESCGCTRQASADHTAQRLFKRAQKSERHESKVLSLIDRMCGATSYEEVAAILSKCLLPDSCVCLFAQFVNTVSENSRINDDELAVISEENNDDIPAVIGKATLVPNFGKWMEDDSLYLLTATHAGKNPCGYFAARITDIFECSDHINRIVKAINIGFGSYLNCMDRLAAERRLASAETHSVITKLPNLRAANEWFNRFSAVEKNHELSLSVSVYCLQQYKNIYENYGFSEAENIQRTIADALIAANSRDCYVAQLSDDEFTVVNYYSDAEMISDVINSATAVFFKLMAEYNSASERDYFAEVNCGCTVVNPGWRGTLASFTKLATAEMYVNRLNAGTTTAKEKNSIPKDFYPAFNALVEKNLFKYHFQPIVNAKNGEIFAYEALMRTDASIGMNPLEVLETAEAYKRLYDIERATMFNIMERFDSEYDKFGGRKVFINSIPGYFLNPSDAKEMSEKYSHHMDHIVFEITEQNAVSEDELNTIRHFGNERSFNQIAIDDYGIGHSNIVNLLRYTPQIIKIDRYLITNIQSDTNKQMFVKSTIEFARMNNIKVLAEGVETSDELKTVVGFGVDFIQGYYTGKPQSEPISEIAAEIRNEIIAANSRLLKSIS